MCPSTVNSTVVIPVSDRATKIRTDIFGAARHRPFTRSNLFNPSNPARESATSRLPMPTQGDGDATVALTLPPLGITGVVSSKQTLAATQSTGASY